MCSVRIRCLTPQVFPKEVSPVPVTGTLAYSLECRQSHVIALFNHVQFGGGAGGG